MRLADEAATLAVAARLGKAARGGLVVCLRGPLGSGKTTFARGFLRALGFKGAVRSPTFALVHEYRRLKPRVYHLDLYRAEEDELENLGLKEYLSDPAAACLIEWPEVALGLLPKDRLEIRLAHAPSGRRLSARARGPLSRAALAKLC